MSSSSTYHVSQKNVTAQVNNSTFEVQNGASLNLFGNFDRVIVDNGAQSVSIQGSNNTLDASTATGALVYSSGTQNVIAAGSNNWVYDNGAGDSVTGGAYSHVYVQGSGDTVAVGANSNVSVSGNGDNVTVGANSEVDVWSGTNSVINAMNGDDLIWVYGATGTVVNAVNDTVRVSAGASCTLSGSNNSILLNQGATVSTGKATLTENQNGIVLTGGTNPGAITLSNGVATVQLDDGNVATVYGVASGSTFKYVDSSGKVTTTTLVDSALLHLGGSLYEVTGNALANQNNGIFEIDSDASLQLNGSNNTIIANEANYVSVSGDGNTIIGTGGGTPLYTVSGRANVVSIGDGPVALNWIGVSPNLPLFDIVDPSVWDNGVGTTLTLGKNIEVIENGTNATVNALKGGDVVVLGGTGNTVNANNITIGVSSSFTLSGSNNLLSMDSLWNPGITVTATHASLTEDQNGITLTGAANAGSVTLVNGTATVQMGDGNVATITQVASGETLTYTDATGKQTTSTLMDSNLQHVAGNLYNVNADVTANLNNLMFDVMSGASLNLNGSADQVILSNGAGSIGINGTGNTIIGSSVSGANVSVSGAGNVVSVGSASTVSVGDGGSSYYGQVVDGNTITVGANSIVDAWGTHETINATKGGAHIKVNASGSANDVVNANTSTIELNTVNATTTVKGNGNQIAFDNEGVSGSFDTLLLSGSNNSVSMDYQFGLAGSWGATQDVETATTSLSVSSNGAIVFTNHGTGAAGAATLVNGVLTVQLGGGNVATVNEVASGTSYEYIDASGKATYTTLQGSGVGGSQLLGAAAPASAPDTQTSLLVAAMASYTGSDAGAAATGGIQTSADSAFHSTLVASSIH